MEGVSDTIIPDLADPRQLPRHVGVRRSGLDHVVHVNIFLGEMRDFEAMNTA